MHAPAGEPPRTVGWCNLGRYRPFEAYDATTEVSLYLHQDFRGLGFGSRVFRHVLEEARKLGDYRTIIVMVSTENEANARFWKRQWFTLRMSDLLKVHIVYIQEAGQGDPLSPIAGHINISHYTSSETRIVVPIHT
ncbi:hypothetical protein PAXINDRAFT_166288 [Paxillus involutus ATCC 200175]|nr:hypothetical protein PAXINDRAFT_166288 [Paxillus involutus ATCC 200175]